MSRLIEDLRRLHRVERPWWVRRDRRAAFGQHAGQLWPILKDRELFIAEVSTVATYYYETSAQEFWSLDRDFPDLVPPRPVMWFEYRFPRVIHSELKGDTDVTGFAPRGRHGALVLRLELKDVVASNIPHGTRWIICAEQFIDYGREPQPKIYGPHGSWSLALDDGGRILGSPWLQSWADEKHNDHVRQLLGWLHPIFLALSWLPRNLPDSQLEVVL